MDREIQRKRLKYRATHRGTKEADAILGGFVETHGPDLSDDKLDALEAILDCSDPDIADWLRGHTDVLEGQNIELLGLIKSYQDSLIRD